jgi:hypothetical protein
VVHYRTIGEGISAVFPAASSIPAALLLWSCFNFSGPVRPPDGGTDADGVLPDGDVVPDDAAPDDAVPDVDGDPDGPQDPDMECPGDCSGRECGDNGCGIDCGECTAPATCSSGGHCVCVPRCDGVACGGGDGCGGTCGCHLDGSFVEPMNWYPNRDAFRQMLGQMRDFGMGTVVIRAVRLVECTGTSCTPSAIIPEDTLGQVLDDVSDSGMEAILGLVDCRSSDPGTPWWGNDTVVGNCLNETEDLVSEIFVRFGSHPAIAGFFLPPSVRLGIDPTTEMTVVNGFYRQAVEAVHGRFSAGPVAAMAWFVAANNTGSTEVVSVDAMTASLRELGGSDVDVVILRDGVGEHKNALWVHPVVGDYIEAARTSASPATLWAGLELYQWSTTKSSLPNDTYFHPAAMARIRQQIDQSQGAVRRIALSFPFHMAEGSVLANSAEAASLYRAYGALYFESTYQENPSYTYGNAPNPSYADNGSRLFDDRTGSESRTADWVGWLEGAGDHSVVTVDLGAPAVFTDVTAVFRSETSFNCHYPVSMAIGLSSDGTDFSTAGSVPVAFTPETDYGQAVVRFSVPDGMSARYVEVTIEHRSPYVLLSEIEIY